MSISGVYAPVVDLVFTLPKTRTDGSALALTDIASVTVLRNSIEWQTLQGPLKEPVKVSDAGATPGVDTYSFYVTDTAGVRSNVSPVAAVSVSKEPPKAPPATGTVTATVQGAPKAAAPASAFAPAVT
jgi:hypothetical protein